MTDSVALKFLVRKRTTFTWMVPLALLIATYFWGRPNWTLFAVGLLLLVLGEVVRFWAAGYIQKDNVIATDGPYGFVRNPLYFGSLLLALGYAAMSGLNWIAWIVLIALFYLFHIAAITYEEEFLKQKFGEPYEKYLKQVPRLIPFPTSAKKDGSEGGHFSMKQALYNREHITAAVTFVTALAFAALHLYTQSGRGGS